MNELRAIDAGSALRNLARVVHEYLASYGSLLLFALLCLSWSLLALPLSALLPPRLGRRFEPPQDPEAFGLELERYYRSELQQATAAARSSASSCR